MEKQKQIIDGQITSEQFKKIRVLIRKECCNCDDGDCEMLDDGEQHKCPQLSSPLLKCNWFIEAVLPVDSVLMADVFDMSNKDTKKRCGSCGKPFIPMSNSAKFCTTCAVKIHKMQQSEYARKKRSNSRQIEAF